MTVIAPTTTNTQTNFWNFVFDIGESESSDVSIFEIKARERFNVLGLVLPAAWTTADIGFEVRFEHESPLVWRPVYFIGKPVRVQTPTVDSYCVADAEIMVILRMPITGIRLTSINPTTYAAVNQAAARTVKMYLSE